MIPQENPRVNPILPAAEMFGALHEEPGAYEEYRVRFDFDLQRYYFKREAWGSYRRCLYETRNMACLMAVRDAMGGNWHFVEDSLEYQVEPRRDHHTGAMSQGVAFTICPFCDERIRIVDGEPDENHGCIHFACADGETAYYVGKGTP